MRGLRTAKTKEAKPRESKTRAPRTREAVCTHCGGRNEVALRAMSVFCAHCKKRLILENYDIKCYQAVSGYATCGDVTVHKQGRVAAPIQAGNLRVKGVVQGIVRVRGHVEIDASGSLSGKLSAPSLTVRDGAKLDAYCEIRPEVPETELRPSGVIAEAELKQPPPATQPKSTRKTTAETAAAAKPAGAVKSISTRRRATPSTKTASAAKAKK